jgi:hypothetical protein
MSDITEYSSEQQKLLKIRAAGNIELHNKRKYKWTYTTTYMGSDDVIPPLFIEK